VLQAVDAVVGEVDREPFLPETGGHELRNAAVVFDDEEAHA
jgi:hypothetical protein